MWILEKFYAWADCNGHPENALTRDELLDNSNYSPHCARSERLPHMMVGWHAGIAAALFRGMVLRVA